MTGPETAAERLDDVIELLRALLRAVDEWDAIGPLIRAAKSSDEAVVILQANGFTEMQSQHVLDLTFRRLTGEGRVSIADELQRLESNREAGIFDLELPKKSRRNFVIETKGT